MINFDANILISERYTIIFGSPRLAAVCIVRLLVYYPRVISGNNGYYSRVISGNNSRILLPHSPAQQERGHVQDGEAPADGTGAPEQLIVRGSAPMAHIP